MFWFVCGLSAFMVIDALTDWIRAKAAELEAKAEKLKLENKQKQEAESNDL